MVDDHSDKTEYGGGIKTTELIMEMETSSLQKEIEKNNDGKW